jgi:hypothetical protein
MVSEGYAATLVAATLAHKAASVKNMLSGD